MSFQISPAVIPNPVPNEFEGTGEESFVGSFGNSTIFNKGALPDGE